MSAKITWYVESKNCCACSNPADFGMHRACFISMVTGRININVDCGDGQHIIEVISEEAVKGNALDDFANRVYDSLIGGLTKADRIISQLEGRN